MSTQTDALCAGFPGEFAEYLNYTRSLKFNDDPNYEHLRKMFRSLSERLNLVYDYQFDWSIRQNDKKQESTKPEPI